MKTNRRWLKSAISAAAIEKVALPWMQKVKSAEVIPLVVAQKAAHIAIAAA